MSGLILQNRMVYFVAGFLSCVLSWWAWFSLDVINTDAICYLQSAETFQTSLNSALHLCNQAHWPFYSFFIFGLQKITQLSFLNTAFILNGIFSLITVLSFIAIIDFLRVNQRVLWFAAVVILLAHEFNAVKAYIVRDHGFWAFYLLSLFFMLHYFRQPRWFWAIAWSLSLVLATLFRIEAIIFFILLPFGVWFDSTRNFIGRVKGFLQLNSILIILLAIAGLWLLGHDYNFGRLNEIQYQLVNGFKLIAAAFDNKTTALANHVLSPYSESDAGWVLGLMLISWYLYCVTFNLSVIYTVLLAYAWGKKLMTTDNAARLVLWSYIIVSVIITSVFLIENMYLTKRYLLALSLILMLWIPFALEKLYQQIPHQKWPLMLAVFLMFVTSLSGIFNFGYSKAYLRYAGEWVALNVPQNAKLYTNNYEIMFYSKHFGNNIFKLAPSYTRAEFFSPDKLKQFDYIALAGRTDIDSKFLPLQSFKNNRGDQVIIYKIPH